MVFFFTFVYLKSVFFRVEKSAFSEIRFEGRFFFLKTFISKTRVNFIEF